MGQQEAQRAVATAEAELDALRADSEATAEDVTEAELALNQALLDTGPAALDVAQATLKLNDEVAKNPALLDQAIGMLGQWVSQGLITQEQADALAFSLAGAASAANDYAGDYVAYLSAQGVEGVLGGLYNVRAAISNIDRDIDIEVEYHQVGSAGGPFRQRALGGPVYRGEGYIVGEKGPEWFEPDINGRIIPNSALSRPMAAMSSGGNGGSMVYINVDMSGAVVSSATDAQRWVADAWNRAAGLGMVTVRGRAL